MFIRQVRRYLFFFLGLIIFAYGTAMAIRVKHLGLHPWDVLNIALNQHLGLTIGTWSLLCGLLFILVTLIFNRKYVNIGTFLNVFSFGPLIDFFLWTNLLPAPTYMWEDYLILLFAIILTGIGGGMYVAAGVGAGPRDGFMLVISERTSLSVSLARMIVESLVLILGYFLGGPVFIVTFIYTFIQSPIFQKSLKIFQHIIVRLEQIGDKKETMNHSANL
jgi:uncharacterized protein